MAMAAHSTSTSTSTSTSVHDDDRYYVTLLSRRGLPAPSPLLSPRLSSQPLARRRLEANNTLRSTSLRFQQQEVAEEEGSSDDDYVQQVSLVHYYYPEERKISKLEKRFEFTGAIPIFLGLQDVVNPEVWRAAISEFLVTSLLIFVSGAGAITCLQAGFTSSQAAISVVVFFCLSFFILASAPASGGHLNPAISLATMLTGFSSPARTFLYIIAQTLGSVVGAFALKVIIEENLTAEYGLGGCTLRNRVLRNGELVEAGIETGAGLLAEFIFTLVLLFFAFSVALYPKQFQVTGPILAPFMIGAVIALLMFVSGGLMDVAGGYTGAGMNPARCFGPAVAMGGGPLWVDHWVWWVGPFLAALAVGMIYHVIPPHHVELYRSRADIFTQFRNLLKPRS